MAKLEFIERCWVCGDLGSGGNLRELHPLAQTDKMAHTRAAVCDKPECQEREKKRLYDMRHRRKDDLRPKKLVVDVSWISTADLLAGKPIHWLWSWPVEKLEWGLRWHLSVAVPAMVASRLRQTSEGDPPLELCHCEVCAAIRAGTGEVH